MNRLFVDHSIGQIKERIASGALSEDAPVAAGLENITELDDRYHAFVPEARRKDATLHELHAEGMLAGIPIGVKDIFNTADFPTQMGSSLWQGFTPGNDARVVSHAKREGAVVIGKTVTAEFAVHALNETVNPYDDSRTPGTSSSGSAVAVATGMVPVALGTQTAGSIIRPASFCGVYGMKPSFGLIPRTGMLKTTDTLDTIGFFTTYAEDLRRVLEALRVHGLNYPVSHAALSDTARQTRDSNRPWRIGIARTHTWDAAPAYAQKAFLAFTQSLPGTEYDVREVVLPEVLTQTHEVHATIYDKALSYYFKQEFESAESMSPVMRELIEHGGKISVDAYRAALVSQTQMIEAMDVYFNDFDILLSLSTAGEAPLREVVELPDPSLMWTLTHLPTVNVPQFTSPDGLPFGFQVVARKYNDLLLITFIEELVRTGIIPSARTIHS